MGKTFKERNPIAKEPRDRRFQQRRVPSKEADEDRRWRRYKEIDYEEGTDD